MFVFRYNLLDEKCLIKYYHITYVIQENNIQNVNDNNTQHDSGFLGSSMSYLECK